MKPSLTLAPRNGLANRIRTIGSAVELSKRINFKCSLIWPLDFHLNCPFEYLFKPSSDFVSVDNYDNRDETLENFILQSARFDKILLTDEVKILKRENYNFEELAPYKSLFISSGAAFMKTGQLWQFRPHDSVATAVSKITSAYPESIIGVHIRRGDNNESIKYSPAEGFIQRMELEISRNNRVSFFLATDSPDEEFRIRSHFPGRIISYRKMSLDRNDPQAIREAFIDLLCLSRTSMVIGSYWSSFSQLAAKIGKIKLVEIKEGL